LNGSNSSSASEADLVARLPKEDSAELYFAWQHWARPAQLPPPGHWTTWLMMGGRGAGKTRAGAEWVRTLAGQGVGPIALVGQTMTEAIEIMVRGESGIMRVHPQDERPVLRGNALRWPNGVEGTVLPANDPERFRGPQFAAAWCDEIGKWPHAEEAWDMLQFGLRLGPRPRQLATTTPRPTRLIKRLLGDPLTVVTRMTTDENPHLADGFLQAVVARYRGTVLGRQELEGELIEDMPGALWAREMIRVAEVTEADCERVVVAIDPPATSGPNADACGIVVAGRRGNEALVLADLTVRPAPPLLWAKRAIAAFHAFAADCIVAEVNQGGEMVKIVLAQVDGDVPVRSVHATRGKWLRAEPVAALYAQGRVVHRPGLTALEDEMCGFGGEVRHAHGSPDRVDALVWALTELMLKDAPAPRVRGV
jgi:phage terminase large subunit-like protein